MNKAVFLDRDGTIIENAHYTADISKFKEIYNSHYAMQKWHDAGYLIIVVTNQSGVARGLFTPQQLSKFHQHTYRYFYNYKDKKKSLISSIYYCPHHEDQNCYCRKPRPGMILTAAAKFNIDLTKSVMIGDMDWDLNAGLNAGIKNSFRLANNNSLLSITSLFT